MNAYELIHISFKMHGQFVYITSTHSQTIDWVLANILPNVKKAIPTCKAQTTKNPFTDQPYFCQLQNLKGNAYPVGWWLVNQLCLQGWEPFAGHEETLYLRLPIQQAEAD